jgi:hypothetical protein
MEERGEQSKVGEAGEFRKVPNTTFLFFRNRNLKFQ